MRRSHLHALSVVCAVLSCLPASFLSAQSGGTCPFSFEPEYMGVGNCFRVILRNNDPTRAPRWVDLTVLGDEAMLAGDVDPSRIPRGSEDRTWHFRNFEPLPVGMSDTAYICLISAIPTVRIALVWGHGNSDVLCRDTVEVDLPRTNRNCVGIKRFGAQCDQPTKQSEEPDEAGSASRLVAGDRRVWLLIDLALWNRGSRGIGSMAVTGPGCTTQKVTHEVWLNHSPVMSGGDFSIQVGPVEDLCFAVDSEIGWRIDSLEFIYYDSANVAVCSDTVVLIVNGFSCGSGNVAESGPAGASPVNLRVVMTKSGEASISFMLEERANVRLSLVDIRGNEVLRVVDGRMFEAGESTIPLNTAGIQSGTYVCLLQAGERSEGKTVQIAR